MKEYYTTMIGVKWDDLIGGHEVSVHIENIRLAEGISVDRGELLARDSQGKYNKFTSSDSNKYLVIARESAEIEDNRVITAYSSGKFNRNKIKVSETIDLEEFDQALRMQGIILTAVKVTEEVEGEANEGSEDE